MPATPYDAKGLLSSAIRDNDPVMFFEHKVLYDMEGEVPEDNYTIPLGVADVKRQGKDADNIAEGFRISGLGQLIEAGIQADRLVVFGD